MYKLYIVGIFPRSSKLISSWKAFERKELDEEEFKKVFTEHIRNVVNLQVSSKLDLIHDPQSNWHDHLRPLTYFDGVDVGPLTRFYENNTFYRRPVFKAIPKVNIDAIKVFLNRHFDDRIEALSIGGPYTLVKHSIFKGVEPLEVIKRFYVELIESILSLGYKNIFLHEPALVYYNPNSNEVVKLYEPFKKLTDFLTIYTYFGKVNKVLESLAEMGFKYTFDMRWNKLDDVKPVNGKILLGLIDGQNTLLEDLGHLKNVIKRFSGENAVSIFNNVDLDFLPYEYAVKKVELLARLREVI